MIGENTQRAHGSMTRVHSWSHAGGCGHPPDDKRFCLAFGALMGLGSALLLDRRLLPSVARALAGSRARPRVTTTFFLLATDFLCVVRRPFLAFILSFLLFGVFGQHVKASNSNRRRCKQRAAWRRCIAAVTTCFSERGNRVRGDFAAVGNCP